MPRFDPETQEPYGVAFHLRRPIRPPGRPRRVRRDRRPARSCSPACDRVPLTRSVASTSGRPSSWRHLGLDLGGLMGMLGSVSGALKQVVASNQAGQPIDPARHAQAEAFGTAMSTPVRDRSCRRRPMPAAIERAEAGLGFALPPFLRRVYGESPTVGSGPVAGCCGSRRPLRLRRMRTGEELPRGRAWPDGLLPVVERDPGFYCVDASTAAGRVVDWDPEELEEFSGEQAFERSFSEEAPSVEAWLGRLGRRQDPGRGARRDDGGGRGRLEAGVTDCLRPDDARAEGPVGPDRRGVDVLLGSESRGRPSAGPG